MKMIKTPSWLVTIIYSNGKRHVVPVFANVDEWVAQKIASNKVFLTEFLKPSLWRGLLSFLFNFKLYRVQRIRKRGLAKYYMDYEVLHARDFKTKKCNWGCCE